MRRTAARALIIAGLIGALVPWQVQASCGAAFCPVNTQWDVQGVSPLPGWRFDLRYEFLDQDQPRQGSERVAVGEIAGHHDEVRTLNRNVVLNVDYAFDNRWSVALSLPYVNREHAHIHNHHGDQLHDAWDISSLGDARVLGRYRFSNAPFSLLFGVKLPTGAIDVANGEGEIAERSLQPGSGTTDAIAGIAYRHAALRSSWSWFAQLEGQRALGEHDGFAPGHQLKLDAGLRYALNPSVNLLMQGNVVVKARDRGPEAEADSSGGEYVFLTPGVSYAASSDTQWYLYVQQSVFQNVNGVQLTADTAYIAGMSMRF